MNQLPAIRIRLRRIRRLRRLSRWARALLTVLTLLALAWLALYTLDLTLHLTMPQRVCASILTSITLIFGFRKWCYRLLVVRESDLGIGLAIERQEPAARDLVAGLQFTEALPRQTASTTLMAAVVASADRIPREQLRLVDRDGEKSLMRRAFLCTASVAFLALIVSRSPEDHWCFWQRLTGREANYSSDTRLHELYLNGQPVLQKNGLAPAFVVENETLELCLVCEGPPLTAASWKILDERRPDLQLHPLSLSARHERLERARTILQAALKEPRIPISRELRDEVSALTCLDAQRVSQSIRGCSRAMFPELITELESAQNRTKPNADRTVLVGELKRTSQSFGYRVLAGDLETSAGSVEVLTRPIVQVELSVDPPEYVSLAPLTSQEIPAGSRIGLTVTSTETPLETVLVTPAGSPEVILDLQPTDSRRLHWELPTQQNPWETVNSDVAFSVHVTDEHGVALADPIYRTFAVVADRIPEGRLSSVHRRVVPHAKPGLSCFLDDDYGLSGASVVVRSTADRETILARIPLTLDGPIRKTDLPVTQTVQLNLAPLELAVGQRILCTLEVTDYRGETAGTTSSSAPLEWEISSNEDVLSDVGDGDAELNQRLQQLIDQELRLEREVRTP